MLSHPRAVCETGRQGPREQMTTQHSFRKGAVALPVDNREGTSGFCFTVKQNAPKSLVTSNDNFIMLTNSVAQEVGQGPAGTPHDVWGLSLSCEPSHSSNCVFTNSFSQIEVWLALETRTSIREHHVVGNFLPVSQLELGSGMSAQVSKTQCRDLFYVTITEYLRLEYLLKIDLSRQDGSAGKGP